MRMLDENDPIDSNNESTENAESIPIESALPTESSENLISENIETASESVPEALVQEVISEGVPNQETPPESNEIINPEPANLIPVITHTAVDILIDDGNLVPTIRNGQVDFFEIIPESTPVETLQNETTQYPIFQRDVVTQMGDELLVQKVFLNSSGQEYQLNCISVDGDPQHIEYTNSDGVVYITLDGGITWQVKETDSQGNQGTSD